MKISVEHHLDSVAVVNIKGSLTQSSSFVELRQRCRVLAAQGCLAVLINLGDCSRVNMSGLAALVELAGAQLGPQIFYCGMNGNVTRKLQSSGLDRALSIFASVETALASSDIQRLSLANTKAVVLCNGDLSRPSAISNTLPPVMLDMLGQPLIQRILGHFDQFGISDVVVNPGHLGSQIIDYVHASGPLTKRIRMANEGRFDAGNWVPKHFGTASSLKRIQERQSEFCDAFLVTKGTQLSNLDLAAMKDHHLKSGAVATVAVPSAGGDELSLANQSLHRSRCKTGDLSSNIAGDLLNSHALFLDPKALSLIPDTGNWDLWRDLLPALLSLAMPIAQYQSRFRLVDVRTAQSYANCLFQGVDGHIPFLQPNAKLVSGNWVSRYACVSKRANISGRSFIGDGAQIGEDVELCGTCVIGAGARVQGPSVLENCVVMAGSKIAPGFWGQNMTIHKEWTVDHRYSQDVIAPILTMPNSAASKDVRNTPLRQSA